MKAHEQSGFAVSRDLRPSNELVCSVGNPSDGSVGITRHNNSNTSVFLEFIAAITRDL